MNSRLNTSIGLLKNFEKNDKIKNCERIKKFNISALVLQLVLDATDFLCDFQLAIEAIICISGYERTFQDYTTHRKIVDVLDNFRLSVIIATQIIFEF